MTDPVETAPKEAETEEYTETDIVTTRLTKPKKRTYTAEQLEKKKEQCRIMREKKQDIVAKRKLLKEECDDAAIENLSNLAKLDKLRRDGNHDLVHEMSSLKEEIKSLRESKRSTKPKPKEVRPPSPPPSTTEGEFVTGSSEEETESEPVSLKKRVSSDEALAKKREQCRILREKMIERRKKIVSESESDVPVERPKTARARKSKAPQEEKSIQIPQPPKKILLFR
mgnify:CR=1 FL=1